MNKQKFRVERKDKSVDIVEGKTKCDAKTGIITTIFDEPITLLAGDQLQITLSLNLYNPNQID